MKNRIIVVILLLATLLCGHDTSAKENCLSSDKLSFKDGIAYTDKVPYTGCMYLNYPNGNLHYEGTLKEGLLDGTYRQYYPEGQLEHEEQMIKGINQGVSKLYWKNGNLKGENTYKDDKLNGKFTKYYEDGKLHVVGNYKDNKLDGEHIIYYPDGSIKSKGTYKDDKKVYQTKQLKINGEMRNAVVVNSVKEEYEYLRQEYPDYKFVMQAAIINDEVESDVLTIESSDKKRKEIYFDISPFYGNYQKMLEEALKKEKAPNKN